MNIREIKANAKAMLVCTLGMGLFLAWTVGNAFTKAFAGIANASTLHTVDMAVGVTSNIVLLVVVAALAARLSSLVTRRGVCIAALACAFLGPLIVVAGVHLGAGMVLMSVGSLMRGVASALLFLMWNELFCRFSMREVGICYGGAYLLSVLVQAVMGALPTAAAFVLVLACALGSALPLIPAAIMVPERDQTAEEDRSWTFPWRPLLLALAFTFTAFMFRQMLADSSASFSWIGGGIVALICTVGCVAFFDKRFDASVLERVALPLIVAGILIWCWIGDGAATIVLMLTDAGNVSFRIFLLAVLCNICYRFGVPCLWLFGIVRAAMMAAEGCGLGLMIWLSSMPGGLSLQVIKPICFVMVIALVAVSCWTQRATHFSDSSWYIVPKAQGQMTRADQLSTVMSSTEMITWKCSRVARDHGLTHREEEVLACLVNGRTRAQIEADLFLSESTVRTHLRHLYSKLGVHSKDEAVALVQQAN